MNNRLMTVLFAVLFISGMTPSHAYDGPKEKLHVYLLIGQSNMAGRAPVKGDDAKPIENAYLLNGEGSWVDAKNPLNIFSTIRKGEGAQKMNPGYHFAKSMVKNGGGASVGLVVNAKGGTRIEQWAKGTQFYKDALRRAQQAQDSGELKGILWHQGESNLKNPDGYLDKLAKLVADLRSDLGDKDLPFVAGQINNGPAINTQIAELPGKVPNTSFISSEGLTCMDRWHFDAPSVKLMGERYATEMLKLQK